MSTKTFIVPNISCGHCTHTIEAEVGEMAGVHSVSAEESSKQVTVHYDESRIRWDEIKTLLTEIDYPPQEG
ncbi:MAG: heavy-metal-associated domain-containing protein [Caldilineaceae bacterium]|nr:heavy-metal-associated domain-containing protein [Caldilineaceae bacterium]